MRLNFMGYVLSVRFTPIALSNVGFRCFKYVLHDKSLEFTGLSFVASLSVHVVEVWMRCLVGRYCLQKAVFYSSKLIVLHGSGADWSSFPWYQFLLPRSICITANVHSHSIRWLVQKHEVAWFGDWYLAKSSITIQVLLILRVRQWTSKVSLQKEKSRQNMGTEDAAGYISITSNATAKGELDVASSVRWRAIRKPRWDTLIQQRTR